MRTQKMKLSKTVRNQRLCRKIENVPQLEAASEPKANCNCRREAEMHPCLLKLKARMRRDHIMSNQACPGVPVAAVGKVGVPPPRFPQWRF